MFHDPIGIIALLLFLEGGILYLSEHRRTRRVFRYVPPMFLIYFLPMLANTVGLIPPERDAGGNIITPVYGDITTYCLPGSLVLLLISVDIVAILRLGKVAIGVMLAGSLGIILGGPVVLLIFRRWLPPDIWSGFGALSASWIGGSANMIAVAKGLETPPHIFGPMVVVDTIVPYAWMGILVAISGWQRSYDKRSRANTAVLDHLTRKNSQAGATQLQPLTLRSIALMFSLASGAAFVSLRLAQELPAVKSMITASAWAIILATAMGIVLSFTPVRRLESSGASKLGYALLYFVLASIGAKTSLAHLASAPVALVAGFVWVLIHAGFIFLAGRLLKAPMSLMATASQANVGGTASAPVVAEIYQPGLAPVGLLLAVLGNIIGTYLGFACSTLCRFASGL